MYCREVHQYPGTRRGPFNVRAGGRPKVALITIMCRPMEKEGRKEKKVAAYI